MNSRIRNKSVEIFFFCQCPDTEETSNSNILFRDCIDYQGVNEFDYDYTKANELGHGAYRLRHTFSEENRYRDEKGKTSNLMDYVPVARAREAEELKKYQWDYIHDPESIWFAWMKEEGEGELGNPDEEKKYYSEILGKAFELQAKIDGEDYFFQNILGFNHKYVERNTELNINTKYYSSKKTKIGYFLLSFNSVIVVNNCKIKVMIDWFRPTGTDKPRI